MDLKRKLAAVLVLVIEIDGVEHLLLTKRSSSLKSHPGQICFAGGKFDVTDKTIIDTAIREAKEEIGLIECQVLQILQPCISAHGLLVYPVLAKADPFEPLLNECEVEKIYYYNFKDILDPPKYNYHDWDVRTSRFYEKNPKALKRNKSSIIRTHQFEINELDILWGLTGEFAIQAAITYFKQEPKYSRKAPDQDYFWYEMTKLFFHPTLK